MERQYPFRAELRCHSVYSPMNGVATVEEIFAEAGEAGITSVAITDTDSVNVYSAVDRLWKRKIIPSYPVMGMDTQVEDDQVTILVRTEEGRSNLYKLLTLKNMREEHVLSWDDINEYHEGLLIGSGASEGKLYKSLKRGEHLSDDLASLYDYIEVLPVSALTGDGMQLADWQEKTKELIGFAKRNDLKAVAVSDAYTYVKSDEFVRNVLACSQGLETGAEAGFLSTEEMMTAFGFLDEDEAYKVVVLNSNLIADECALVFSTTDQREYPSLENMDSRLRDICYERAESIYGSGFSEEIKKRLEWELEAIRNTGAAFVLLLLRELMEKNGITANDISIRGASGGSLAVYLCGISSYSPLDFDLVPYFAFGYNQNRMLDIDLNVPTDMLEDIHESCKTLEGLETALRAGTECRLSYQAVTEMLDLFEQKKRKVDRSERIFLEERLKNIVTGKNGLHPGGMIYIPKGSDIVDATPITTVEGKPVSSKEYYVFDEVFYKQDILSHDDVQLIYNLRKRTGVDLEKISIDDEDILSLFKSPERLGIEPRQIDGYSTGLLGLSAYSISFFQRVFLTAQVNSFNDMVRIELLSHGTGTWTDNAEVLINEGIATLDEVITCRDDVFDYLVEKGIYEEQAFYITERVRKGKGLTEDDRILLIERGVPDWYIESCGKIRYLFPKAHSISYIIKLWRLAYFKIHYPREFYEEYFRVKDFGELNTAINEGYQAFCRYAEGKMLDDGMLSREYAAILLAKEMYARGAEFVTE